MARTAKPKAKAPAGRTKAANPPAKAAAKTGAKRGAKTDAKRATKTGRPASAPKPETNNAGWATDLVFDVKEPKLAVSLRLDADVLRFFRGFGAGYQTRINEVLRSFMQARQRAGLAPAAETAKRVPAAKKSGRGRTK